MFFILKPLLRRPLMPLLVILQVALACAIATNALFLLRQKLAPILTPSGVANPERLMVVSNVALQGQPPSAALIREIQAELRSVPNVEHATYAASFPMVAQNNISGTVEGAAARGNASAVLYIGDNLLPTLGLRVVAGRAFSETENGASLGENMGFNSPTPVIVTRALADRLYPDGHAVGQMLYLGHKRNHPHPIVGVVAHLMRNSFTNHTGDLGYAALLPGVASSFPIPIFAVRTRGAGTVGTCKALTAVVRRNLGADLIPSETIACDTYAHLRDKLLAQPRAAVWLLAGVTLIVLLVTLAGVMGLTGYWVQQRTHSIGVKRALGARRSDILCELLVENLCVVGIGMIAGLIAAYGINLWLMAHYELLRLPWTYLPIGAVLLLVLGQLAALTPALRASRVPPIVATRAL